MHTNPRTRSFVITFMRTHTQSHRYTHDESRKREKGILGNEREREREVGIRISQHLKKFWKAIMKDTKGMGTKTRTTRASARDLNGNR